MLKYYDKAMCSVRRLVQANGPNIFQMLLVMLVELRLYASLLLSNFQVH